MSTIAEAYLVTVKNLKPVLEAIQNAQAPQRFSQEFLSRLGFQSSNDRAYVKLFKDLGFVTDSGQPTQVYFNFLDKTISGRVLAKAIFSAYYGLFEINKKAYMMSSEEIKNKLRTLTQGQFSENVYQLKANTFRALCDEANWNDYESEISGISLQDNTLSEKLETSKPLNPRTMETKPETPSSNEAREKLISELMQKLEQSHTSKKISTELHYNLQIILPKTTDQSVYDAIFKSLKDHLLS